MCVLCTYEGGMVKLRRGGLCSCIESVWSSLERLVEADGGGAVEDHVDAGAELLHVPRADGEARLRQLAADGDDLLVEVGVVLPHAVEQLPEQKRTHRETSFLQAILLTSSFE